MSKADDYYVYVYIDPRNYEEFYYGKGTGARKDAHLSDTSDSEKAKRIGEIRNEGLAPIIRVVARGLTESQAFLVEKTLLWKLGKTLTNQATGNFAEKFRPHNKLHRDLSGFDYVAGIYNFNVGQGEHRKWSDCRKFGFISAGQGARWAEAIQGFNVGDTIAAYVKGHGFVGIGRITQKARPIRDVRIADQHLLSLPLECRGMLDNVNSDEMCEWVALVHWHKFVAEGEAPHWLSKSGLFKTQLVRASLEGQKRTLEFLEERFQVKFEEIRERRAAN